MTFESQQVLLGSTIGLCAISTAAIAYFSRVILPGRKDRRIRQAIQAFGTAVELRIPANKGLSERVVALSLAAGRRLQLSPRTLQRIELSARLRDIGLCSVPYDLVNRKRESDWNEADWATYFRHAEVGGAMLELVPSLRDLAPIVRWHHARYDTGPESGFPTRSDIPIEARILKVVSDYVYLSRNKGMILARDEVIREAGKAYDPKIVDALLIVLTSARVESASELVPANSI